MHAAVARECLRSIGVDASSITITLFSDEQLVALSNIFERSDLARRIVADRPISSTITTTLPAPTPIAGVPLE